MGRTGAPQSSPDLAQSKFELRLADDLISRCVIHVLPKGVTDLGFTSTLPTSRRRATSRLSWLTQIATA
jgi:hypothetical protein